MEYFAVSRIGTPEEIKNRERLGDFVSLIRADEITLCRSALNVVFSRERNERVLCGAFLAHESAKPIPNGLYILGESSQMRLVI